MGVENGGRFEPQRRRGAGFDFVNEEDKNVGTGFS
jgi:hypothetical protein